MTEYKLELSGMSCGACERIIERLAEKNGAKVKEIDGNTGRVVVEIPGAAKGEEGTDINEFKAQLAEKGFFEKGSGAGQRGDFSRVAKYLSAVISGEENVAIESRLLNYGLGTGAGLIILSAVVYALFLRGTANGFAYLPIMLLAAVASVSTVFSFFHCACYRKFMGCTNGMMVGMTMGMVPGLMAGAILGATNGMFVGSVTGMLFGMGLGYKLGKCCGVMGAMEGLMAGLMAGTMGAMLSVMMLRDNLMAFLFLLFASGAVILFGLSYMLYREQGAAPAQGWSANFPKFFFYALLLFILFMSMAFLGPKSTLVYP